MADEFEGEVFIDYKDGRGESLLQVSEDPGKRLVIGIYVPYPASTARMRSGYHTAVFDRDDEERLFDVLVARRLGHSRGASTADALAKFRSADEADGGPVMRDFVAPVVALPDNDLQ